MSTDQLRVVGAGLFLFFIFLTGVRLTRSGKPYSMIVLTIHKLISLAAAVLLVVTIYQINQVATLSTIELSAGVVTGLLFLGTGILGGILSTDKPVPGAILRLHQTGPFLTVFCTAVTLYLLLGRK